MLLTYFVGFFYAVNHVRVYAGLVRRIYQVGLIGLPSRISFNSGEQFGNRDVEATRDRKRRLNSEVVLTALNRSHVGAMQTTVIRERLLRESFLLSEIADSPTESLL